MMNHPDVAEALNRRRVQLEERRQRLDLAIAAIRQAGLITKREQILHVIGLNWAMTQPDPASGEGHRLRGRREWKEKFAESLGRITLDRGA